jgi:thiol-disulfide isomerase/thioredoxin
VLLIVVAGAALVAIQYRRPKPPNPFVGLTLPTIEAGGWLNAEQPLAADDLLGNIVLVDFWATDCPSCVSDMPELVEFHQRFAEQGVQVVGLTHEPTTEAARVKEYVQQAGIDWPIGYGAGFTFELAGVHATPTYVLFDRAGRSVWGGHSLQGLDDATLAELAK